MEKLREDLSIAVRADVRSLMKAYIALRDRGLGEDLTRGSLGRYAIDFLAQLCAEDKAQKVDTLKLDAVHDFLDKKMPVATRKRGKMFSHEEALALYNKGKDTEKEYRERYEALLSLPNAKETLPPYEEWLKEVREEEEGEDFNV